MLHEPSSDAAPKDVAPVLETPRLQLRKAVLSDRSFFCRLLNEPSWIEHIGDRGVRCDADAEVYIRNSIWTQYRARGHGLYVVQLKPAGVPIGICGLIRREFLSVPDLGFALLPEYVGHGYALEAAGGVMSHVKGTLGIERLYAIVRPGNERSVRVLERLGFRLQGPLSTPRGEVVELYATT